MSEKNQGSQNDDIQKTEDVNIKGITDEIEIQTDVDIPCKNQPPQNNKEPRDKLSKKIFLLYFILPILIIVTSIAIDIFIDKYFHLTLFTLPLAIGFLLYQMLKFSPTSNIDYWKKLIDTSALLFSTLSVSIFIFKTMNVENPYLNYIVSLNNENSEMIKHIAFYFIMILVYSIVSIFAVSVTIKTLFTYDELKATKNNK
ncbi:TPA: hypothetical protein NU581_000891 [Citrobacter freundii]|nr:hypothetical protein [Citrobacter freundii]